MHSERCPDFKGIKTREVRAKARADSLNVALISPPQAMQTIQSKDSERCGLTQSSRALHGHLPMPGPSIPFHQIHGDTPGSSASGR